MLNGLDLFSGIGGISIALQPWVRTIAYCESDKYAQSVLLSNMQRGYLEYAPIWTDVCTLRRERIDVPIDIISGGFPCQDISVAGTGKGLEGERSGLFFEILRLAEEIKPTFVFLENVPAIRTRGLDVVIKGLADRGYDCRWTAISAQEVGANHRRKRWFLLATYPNSPEIRKQSGGSRGESRKEAPLPRQHGETRFMANSQSLGWSEGWPESEGQQGRSKSPSSDLENALSVRLQESHRPFERFFKGATAASWWATEPSVGRVVNGLPSRVDRVRCLGNSVVPLQAQIAFKRLMGL